MSIRTLGIFLTFVPSLCFAEVPPGADFRLNAYTTSSQHGARVAPAPGGGFVAVWQSLGQDGSQDGLFGRRFNRLGAPLGGEFQINSDTTGGQFAGPLYSDAEGNFVVVWTQPATTRPLVGRRFDRTGRPLTAEFVVTTDGSAALASIARGRDGKFLVAWRGVSGIDNAIQARWFDAASAPMGAEFTLKPGVEAGGVTSLPGGGFLGTWTARGRMSGRLFDPDGLPLSAEFPLATNVSSEQPQATAVDGAGGFVVAWGRGPSLAGDVYVQRFDATGQPVSPEVKVNSDVTQFRLCGSAAFLGDGSFLVDWLSGNTDFDVAARHFDAAGVPLGPEFLLPAFNDLFQESGTLQAMPGGYMIATWATEIFDGDNDGLASYGRLFGVVPVALAVDTQAGPSNGNGVLEPGETVAMDPSWANALRQPFAMSGTVSGFGGPGTATYAIADGSADYGVPAVGSTAACRDTGNCYTLSVSDPAARPATHWDATVHEQVTGGGALDWTLHVGRSFDDVPASSGAYRFVETMLHRSITVGCAATRYCPADATSREQMAVFVLVARESAGYRPAACTTPLFDDVPAASPFCPFVEELARRGVANGCGGGNYCPHDAVTRAQMAVFVLRTLDPTLVPPACSPPNLFTDVPETSPFCPWIEELARRGAVTGCGGGRYCPADAVTREQMSVFLSGTFGLTLYGP